MLSRWRYQSTAPKIGTVCSNDAPTVFGVDINCTKFAAHIGAAFIAFREIAQGYFEHKDTQASGPAEPI
jgi:hypothetical protein